MKIVWERDRSTVRDVYETLLERRKVAYTTVMTMMKILEQKKYLKKTVADRAYVFENGHLVLEGSAAELCSDERVQRVYLGGG